MRPWVVCIAALAAAAIAAPAAHAWSPPVDLSGAGRDASVPQVAVDDGGDAVFVWRRFDGANFRIQARARSAAGVLSGVQTLSGAGQDASAPQVAVDPDGDAVFTWARRSNGVEDFIQARRRSAAGVLGPVITLSGGSAFEPQVAVDDAGDAVFTWSRFVSPNFRIQARALSAGGVLSGVQSLSAAGQLALNPQLDVDADGDAVFAWRRFDGANQRAQTRARSAAGTLSAVQNLSDPGADVSNAPGGPDVGVDDTGDAVFSWGLQQGLSRIQTRARSAAGTLSAVQNVSEAGRSADKSHIDVDADGDAVYTYRSFDGNDNRALAGARSAAGIVSTPQNLSKPGEFADAPQLAVEPDGDAVFVWFRSDGTFTVIESRTRSAAGALGFPVFQLSLTGQNAVAPQVGVDPAGNAVATWQRPDGSNTRVQASADL